MLKWKVCIKWDRTSDSENSFIESITALIVYFNSHFRLKLNSLILA